MAISSTSSSFPLHESINSPSVQGEYHSGWNGKTRSPAELLNKNMMAGRWRLQTENKLVQQYDASTSMYKYTKMTFTPVTSSSASLGIRGCSQHQMGYTTLSTPDRDRSTSYQPLGHHPTNMKNFQFLFIFIIFFPHILLIKQTK